MPDKNPIDWTPDEAFWNEGWTDMDRRLTRKNRRPVFLLLLLGCLVAAGTLVWYTSTEPPLTADAAGLVRSAPEQTTSTTISPTESRDADPDRPRERAAALPTARDPADLGGAERARSYMVSRPTSFAPAPADPLSRPPRSRSPEARDNRVTAQLESRLMYLPQGDLLPTVRVASPPVDTVLEAATFVGSPTPSAWSLTLGSNVYGEDPLPGGSVEIGYRMTRGKWFVPVALRYDYSRRKMTFDNGVTRERALAAVNAGGGSTLNLSYADIRSPGPADQLDRLTTHTLELRTGIGRQLTDRISLSGGLGGNYLLAGRGPTIVAYADGTDYVILVEQRALFSASGQADRAAAGDFRSVDTPVNRWGMNGWLNIDYRVAGKWSAGLGLTQQFTEIYREEILSGGRTRFEVRITKAW